MKPLLRKETALKSLLIANRGEIAIRIIRAAAELGLKTVAVHSEDDAQSLHTRLADVVRPLKGTGPAAYLDAKQLIAVALEANCDAIHPGYGFLSENAGFARLCHEAGITFVGPGPEILDLFGDKPQARALAVRCDVPVLQGTNGPTSLEEAKAFFVSLGPGAAVMVKAAAGGGGRGMRLVLRPEELAEAYARCQSEALQAFGSSEVYVERYLPRTRHVEVQIVGDGTGAVTHLWERECSLQRRNQKLVEVAPCPTLPPEVRNRLLAAAVRMMAEVKYNGVGTAEFLVHANPAGGSEFAFIEVNARLQVEHTVTEAVTGVDLVKTQLALAGGRTLHELGLDRSQVPIPRGLAIQMRVNTEVIGPDGTLRPTGGVLSTMEVPSGPGIRVDTYGYSGYRTNPRFDSLLAKVIAHNDSGDLAAVMAKAHRALGEFRIEGVETNIPFLQNLMCHPDVVAGRTYTRFVDDHSAELALAGPHRQVFAGLGEETTGQRRAGARVDTTDPLAVLDYGKRSVPTESFAPTAEPQPDGLAHIVAPLQGTIVAVDVRCADVVRAGQQLLVLEAMKMEHVVRAEANGVVRQVQVAVGDTIYQGQMMLVLEPAEVHEDSRQGGEGERIDLDAIRTDLAEVRHRHALTLDAARPGAVAVRQQTGQRTARENVDDLCDPDSFVEFAPLVFAAQRLRRPVEELMERTPADGIVTGFGQINGSLFGPDYSQCAVVAYDYTVLAGTQGRFGHDKMDRMFELTARRQVPLVLFAEGGGGRAGDTDGKGVAGLNVLAFHLYAKLSGLVPLVGIVSGRCFAGNAALLGCSDVIIATANSTIGMGGPAMIEGGNLGIFRPEEVGPMSVQVPNGVVDIPVADETEAVAVAKRYISYFQGSVANWECVDQRKLRWIVPEKRLRAYDVRSVIETMADSGSVLELRRHFGPAMVTALARIEGRPVGVIANNPTHLAGAIDATAADKASRFMQLCDAFGLPILFLCDTPGIMVGPEAEKEALVRHASRMFVVGANLRVPIFTIVLRKSYGLGALAMAGGSSRIPHFVVSWPTGEFGGMGLEGQVKLGYRKELAAIVDPAERKRKFDEMVAQRYQHGKALNAAAFFEIDDVIDPPDSRRWIRSVLTAFPPDPRPAGKRRPHVDTW